MEVTLYVSNQKNRSVPAVAHTRGDDTSPPSPLTCDILVMWRWSEVDQVCCFLHQDTNIPCTSSSTAMATKLLTRTTSMLPSNSLTLTRTTRLTNLSFTCKSNFSLAQLFFSSFSYNPCYVTLVIISAHSLVYRHGLLWKNTHCRLQCLSVWGVSLLVGLSQPLWQYRIFRPAQSKLSPVLKAFQLPTTCIHYLPSVTSRNPNRTARTE